MNIIMKPKERRKSEEVKDRIAEQYCRFVKTHGQAPRHAHCLVEWQDSHDRQPVIIALSATVDMAENNHIFFYCEGVDGLKKLTEYCGEDFMVVECMGFSL